VFPATVIMVQAITDTAAVCGTAEVFFGLGGGRAMNLNNLKLWKITPKFCTEAKDLVRSL
jgi:hypothetical protein